MKKHNIAILGFGVVGGGVASLITKNKKEIESYLGVEVNIKHILDLRDFPGSPFESLVTHNYDVILQDKEVDTVIEVMGGSHPAREYTVAALSAGKNVISSNKEVVANFGDEFLKLAKENGVCYKYEASVGGGIPVISPLEGALRQNKIKEIRGILNGTTNYILTQMFTYGESFDNALRDAQKKGYAESNPDADILGIDACRKITILSAIATGKLVDTSLVPTEGITSIRKADVIAAEKLGYKIKLLGRCIIEEDGTKIMVAPFLIDNSSALAGVNGVYNAVEVVAEPLGNVMLYGPGAGAGATASAVVADLAPIVAGGARSSLSAQFVKDSYSPSEAFASFVSRSYVALPLSMLKKAKEVFGETEVYILEDEFSFITPALKESTLLKMLESFDDCVKSRIRLI